MKVEQNIRAIMPILMDKNFSRQEKEETVYKLVRSIARLAWDNGSESMYQDNRGNEGVSWVTWWKNITENNGKAKENTNSKG